MNSLSESALRFHSLRHQDRFTEPIRFRSDSTALLAKEAPSVNKLRILIQRCSSFDQLTKMHLMLLRIVMFLV
jgi:hypothetical protein